MFCKAEAPDSVTITCSPRQTSVAVTVTPVALGNGFTSKLVVTARGNEVHPEALLIKVAVILVVPVAAKVVAGIVKLPTPLFTNAVAL